MIKNCSQLCICDGYRMVMSLGGAKLAYWNPYSPRYGTCQESSSCAGISSVYFIAKMWVRFILLFKPSLFWFLLEGGSHTIGVKLPFSLFYCFPKETCPHYLSCQYQQYPLWISAERQRGGNNLSPSDEAQACWQGWVSFQSHLFVLR